MIQRYEVSGGFEVGDLHEVVLAEEHDAEVARLEALVPKWISVGERLPENTKAVIVWCPECADKYTAYWDFEEWWFFGGFGLLTETVTHWMPLPEDPEEA